MTCTWIVWYVLIKVKESTIDSDRRHLNTLGFISFNVCKGHWCLMTVWSLIIAPGYLVFVPYDAFQRLPTKETSESIYSNFDIWYTSATWNTTVDKYYIVTQRDGNKWPCIVYLSNWSGFFRIK